MLQYRVFNSDQVFHGLIVLILSQKRVKDTGILSKYKPLDTTVRVNIIGTFPFGLNIRTIPFRYIDVVKKYMISTCNTSVK